MRKVDPMRHVVICYYCERRMWCGSEYQRREFVDTLKLMGWRWRGIVAACPDHAPIFDREVVKITLPYVGPKRAMLGGAR